MKNDTHTNMSSPQLEIFDPALCCSTGVCGPEVDQELVRFAADAAWASAQGAKISRYNLAQQPLNFATQPLVAQVLQVAGESALPVTLLGGQVALAGRYPRRAELERWLGLNAHAELTMLPSLETTHNLEMAQDNVQQEQATQPCCTPGTKC